MKVTDCGCFGDFLKLEPRISFMKDLVLLVPAIYFVFRHRNMHQLFSSKVRGYLLWGLTLLLLVYCIRNTYWDLPHTDFRPFKNGVNIAAQKAAEEKSEAEREIISYKLKNLLNGKFVELPYAQYLKEYKSYPKTDWEIVETVMSEPAVPESKISDFIIYGPNEEDVTDQILTNPDFFLMFVCHKLYYEGSSKEMISVVDTLIRIDTLIEGRDTSYQQEMDLAARDVEQVRYQWNEEFLKRFEEVVLPIAQQARATGVNSIAVVGGADRSHDSGF